MRKAVENQDWKRSSLFEVTNRDALLDYLRQREHESRLKVEQETARRRQIEIERQLDEFDKEINLKRLLRSDKRYLSIGSDRPKSRFFDPATMARIARHVSLHRRHKQKQHDDQIDIEFPPIIDSIDVKTCQRSHDLARSSKRTFSSSNLSGLQAVKLPELITFKKSENSDIVNHHLELQQFIRNKNKAANNKQDYSIINTSISIIKPKY